MFNLPNLITAANLFFGCCALISLFQGNPTYCILFVLLAALMDFIDGFVARKMHLESALGLQLDSLSDLVSFGVVPGFICFKILQEDTGLHFLIPYITFTVILAAAFRLARYNISGKGSDHFFTGLPVPANALFFLGILSLHIQNADSYFTSSWLILALAILFSYLMISRLKILKVHLDKEWLSKYYLVIIPEILILICAFWFGSFALSILILYHILCSILISYLIK